MHPTSTGYNPSGTNLEDMRGLEAPTPALECEQTVIS